MESLLERAHYLMLDAHTGRDDGGEAFFSGLVSFLRNLPDTVTEEEAIANFILFLNRRWPDCP